MRGRKPKPTKRKVIQGTFRKDRANKYEADPDVNIPNPPKNLKGEALKEWKRVTVELYANGLLTNLDRGTLTAYCEAYGRWMDAVKILEKSKKVYPEFSGLVIKTTNGNYINNPILNIAQTNRDRAFKYGSEFGMTPTGRARAKAEKVKKEAKEGFENLIAV